jgi:type I restriction enzyme S subunit
MKLETFFERFDQFADAPDAAAKMRALVFELAVRGRLSDRRASDYKDSEWLTLLKTFDGKCRGTQLNRKPTFDIPNSWRWATLNDLGDTKPRNDAPDTATCSFVPMAYISAEYGNAVEFEERTWGEVRKGYTHFSDGDVVMAKITPCFENGKSAIVDNLVGGIGAGTTELHVFRRSSEVIEPRFVLLYLKSHGFIERGIPRMTGSAGQKRVPSDYFANSPLPLPPPAEQKRIVAKVDELMALCDRLEAQQKKQEVRHVALSRAAVARFDEAPTPANLNLLFHGSYTIAPTELRKVILNLAIQGKLVEQNPEDVPAISTFKKLAGYAIDIAENELPAQWMLVPLGKMGEWRGGGTPSKSNAEFWAGEIPWVSPKDMKVLRIADSEDHISEAAIRSSSVKMIPTGSVLMVVRGMILARAFPVALTLRDVTINQDMKSLFPLEQETRDFLLITLRAMEATILSAVERSSHGTCKLRTEILESIQIPIPPLAEQLRICAKVDRLMKLVDQLEARLTASAETGIELLEAVVHELLRAAANVIEFPSSEPNQASRRAAVGCYAIEHLVRNPSFGRTMLMKVCYLSETHLDVPLGWKPMRQAAGPYDPEIETLELSGTRNGWFTVTEKALSSGRSKYEYLVKDRLKAKAAEAISVLGERKAEFDRLLSLFAEKSTEEAEIIATLFAAWNDLLIDGMSPSGNDIIREVRENWHPQKERFSASLLQQWLDWMRRNRLIPKGCGPRTIQQLKLALK